MVARWAHASSPRPRATSAATAVSGPLPGATLKRWAMHSKVESWKAKTKWR